ncbi:hypothetical protein BDV95DRAFT_492872 [Massariosphaeria phaeospora]|uniref:DUF221-domain-containing protein n=1 Tax=Massariosphaeria phaeospora TaxID=100035 RepID=A0A7C8IE71_9PLEO|nr:hypothetical protein BDV95DRAFT_492872 [Massariosphaeria phaeospora]
MKDPFADKGKYDPVNVQQNSVIVAVLTSLGITAAIFVGFCLLRPFNKTVYAPRLRYTDEKHRPPPLGKGIFAWYNPVFKTNEDEYVEKIGLDATIFLRFGRMCRNMFAVLAVVGCAILIPVNLINSNSFKNNLKSQGINSQGTAIIMMTPRDLFGQVFWTFIGISYVFDIIVCSFLWWTYRAVYRLRRKYMASTEYQNSLYARTLIITDIPRDLRTDQGIVDITDSLRSVPEIPRPSIGRNVKDIPELIEEHEKAVVDLESVLAKYLKHPDKLPTERPLCKPSKKDPEYTNKEAEVDAIIYLTARIERLEEQIKRTRETVDKRNPLSYGFASYETIDAAHSVAFSARNKHPKGTTVRLAPKPRDIIWKNLTLDPKTRRWRRFVNNLWIALLTALYFIPNSLIAVFLVKLSNIALLWPKFEAEMGKNQTFWAIVQGIAAPALTSLFYYFLPIIFRRLSIKAGDYTKTSRERHVIHQLYSFFVVNNLVVFSLFGIVVQWVLAAINISRATKAPFVEIIKQIHPMVSTMIALCNISPFWVTWLVQRNLGAAIDLAQVVNLAWGSFSRKFLNPTPREMIIRTAPPAFDYASYYNYFLFYSTVALCFAPLQPITLVVTAFYFAIDSWMKKYLLMYVFCTKNESGGLYWRVLFNRMLTGAFLSNCIVALMVGAKGDQLVMMLGAMVPLPLLLLGFKVYCRNAFDNPMKYYSKGEVAKGSEAPAPIDKESRRRDRVAVRFGHPALYQKLTVPMVHDKSKHLLSELYRGQLDGDLGGTAGYSDVYSMKRMSKEHPGKAAGASSPFEFVSENKMDFQNFKDRPEFSDEHGGEGSVYGHDTRPGTPGTMLGSERGRTASRDSDRPFSPEDNGVIYPTGYHSTPSNLREYSPSPNREFGRVDSNSSNPYHIRDETNLLGSAAPMGSSQTPGQGYAAYTPDQDGRTDYFRSGRM